jgi:predicted kinase
MEKKMVVLVGLPRAGKSTYAQKFKENEEEEYFVVCLDEVRKMVYNQEYNQAIDYVAIKTHHHIIEFLLKAGANIIIDGTNTRQYVRKEMISLARKYGYKVYAHWVPTPVEICKERAIQTGKPELVDVIDRQLTYFNKDEFLNNVDGFDGIRMAIDQITIRM